MFVGKAKGADTCGRGSSQSGTADGGSGEATEAACTWVASKSNWKKPLKCVQRRATRPDLPFAKITVAALGRTGGDCFAGKAGRRGGLEGLPWSRREMKQGCCWDREAWASLEGFGGKITGADADWQAGEGRLWERGGGGTG